MNGWDAICTLSNQLLTLVKQQPQYIDKNEKTERQEIQM